MKIVIIGGVAGGASAATRARRLSEDAEIVLIERGPDVSFANCGMPYHIGEEIVDRQKLLVVTPQRLRERYRLDVRVQTEVTRIDRQRKQVEIKNLATGEVSHESYDKLILATGAAPIKPPLPGIELPGIFTLRNLVDMDRIKSSIDQGARHAVIVGAGFIGLELAENLVRRGVQTTIVEMNNQVLTPFDHEITAPILQELEHQGVVVRLKESVTGFESGSQGLLVKLASGPTLAANLVLVGIGVRPENRLAVAAGLAVGPRGGIQVNKFLQTSDQDIYAVGDAIETHDFLTGRPTQVPLAGPANRQGRIAANQIFGQPTSYRGTQGTAILRVFTLTAAMTGLSEKAAKQAGQPYRAVYLHPAQHAGYYPGAQGMTIKLLFAPDDGKILGAQIIGGEGADKRIDVLAVAIQAGMTVAQLAEAELAYSPQYGSAKDPINMAGFLAEEVRTGRHAQIRFEELIADHYLVDVRTPEEFAQGHLPGAVNLPVDQLRQRLEELPRDREIVTYCQVGQRGYLAQRLLAQRGFSVQNLSGGYKTWLLYQGRQR